jgi:hypothetical protein
MDQADFEKVVEQGRQLQVRLAAVSPVAVGGTAVAIHCGHRFSLDVDVVTPHLAVRYEEVLANLEAWDGWHTNRQTPRVLILGERAQIELGVRQQRRSVPLHVTRREGLVVPTAAEMLRIKAFLLGERRAVRDFVDVSALRDRLGFDRALAALRYINAVYAPAPAMTWASRFAEACEGDPSDLREVALTAYKGLRAPYDDWAYVAGRCRDLGRALIKEDLTMSLPTAPDAGFESEEDTP